MENITEIAKIIKDEIPEYIEVDLDKVIDRIKSIFKENNIDFENIKVDDMEIIRDAIIDGSHSCLFDYIPHLIMERL